MRQFKLYLLSLLCTFLTFSSNLYAVGSAGFENATFSSNAIAQSNAVTAQADEPATISYNPAGIADLKGLQIQNNISGTSIITRMGGDQGSSYSSGTMIAVPTAYLSMNLGDTFNDRLAIGIGSDSPFGLSNRYDSNVPAVHYTGYANWIKMYTLKPVVAFKVTDWFTIGGGAMNYRVFDAGGVFAYPNKLLAAGLPDGQWRFNSKGSSWGWHLGALLRPSPKHSMGFYFRSPVNVNLKGLMKVENATNSGNFETGIWGSLQLPMNMTWGYAYKPSEKTTVELDLGYTRWSTVENLDVNIDRIANAADNAVLGALEASPADYRDTLSVHLGGKHKINEKWEVRGGALFYTNAVRKKDWSPRLPDSHRLGFSVGTSYQVTKNLTIEGSYLYILGLARTINNSLGSETVLGSTVDGRYISNYHVLIMTAKLMWDNFLNFSSDEESDKALDRKISSEYKKASN